IRPPLVILAVPPTTPYPSKGPLHHPPYWEWFKCRRPRRRAANHHIPSPAARRRQPFVISMVAVLGVPEDGLQARECFRAQLCHDFLGTHAVIDAGRRHHDGNQQSQRVHHDMALAAVDVLGPVVAVLTPDLGALHRLTVDTDGAGTGLPVAFLRRGGRG